MASHLIDEVEKVCSDVAVLKNGMLLEKRSLTRSTEDGKLKLLEIKAPDLEALEKVLESMAEMKVVNKQNGALVVETGHEPSEVNRQLAQKGLYLSHLAVKRKTLEEQFLEITR
jgi:ABC-2 type transport system ATP-binding protein